MFGRSWNAKLFWGIMTPSGILTVIFGFAMVIEGWAVYQTQWWLHLKLVFVLFLLGYHVLVRGVATIV